MLTPEQLVAVRPIVCAVARGFKRVADPEDLEQEALLVLWRDRDAFTGTDAEAMHWAGRVSRRVFINAGARKEVENAAMEMVTGMADFCHRAVPTPEETCLAQELYSGMPSGLRPARRVWTHAVMARVYVAA